MADSDKDILITPNVSQTSQPEIKFVGKDNSPMYLKVLDDNTLSFEGTEGQVFSINPTMSSGDIFSVSDISGIQSMSVNADGTIALSTPATPNFFHINPSTQRIGVGDAGTAPDHLLHLEGIDGGNGELFVERASGAGIKTQAQASTGVFGTSTNHTLALMTNGSQRVKINNVGGIEAVSNANGWNLWHKLTFGVLDYGTATGQGNGLKLLTFDDNEAGLPKYALPRDITIRAVSFHTNGVVLSGSTAQVFRIFANGDAGAGTLTNISYNASQFTRQNSENANATDHTLVVTGVDASYNAGDTLACRRESGAVDMGDYVVNIWYSIDNA